MKKKWLSFSGLLNILLLAVFIVVLFIPSAKALLIQGMMKIGLFQPALPIASSENNMQAKVSDVAF